MMDAIEQSRLEQLERCIPKIWTSIRRYFTVPILYIGAYRGRFHFYNRIRKAALNMDVIEIDRKACDYLENIRIVKNVHCCDIRTYINLVDLCYPMYDTIIWSHGVETILREEGLFVLKNLERVASSLIVNMTPYGDAGGTGNVSVWYPHTFEKLGYKTDTLGNEGELNSNLLAWKYL